MLLISRSLALISCLNHGQRFVYGLLQVRWILHIVDASFQAQRLEHHARNPARVLNVNVHDLVIQQVSQVLLLLRFITLSHHMLDGQRGKWFHLLLLHNCGCLCFHDRLSAGSSLCLAHFRERLLIKDRLLLLGARVLSLLKVLLYLLLSSNNLELTL